MVRKSDEIACVAWSHTNVAIFLDQVSIKTKHFTNAFLTLYNKFKMIITDCHVESDLPGVVS